MKHSLPVLFLLITSFASAQIVNIPDPGFKFVLLQQADANHDGEIQVSEAQAIISLNIYDYGNPNIIDITGIEAFTHMKRLQFNIFNLSQVDLRHCDSLTYLNLGLNSCNYGTVNVSGLTKLDSIYGVGRITNLIAQNCTSLKVIMETMLGGIYGILDVTGCTNLKNIGLSDLNVTSLDLSTCTSGVYISTIIAPYLTNLNLKNGAHDYWSTIDAAFIGPVVHICADSFELNSIIQGMGYSTPATIEISPYCSYFPGGLYNTIKGTIKADLDNNGCDAADLNMEHVPINITDNFGNAAIIYTDALGRYMAFGYVGTFTLTAQFPNPYFSINPNPGSVTFNAADAAIDTIDFCVTPTGAHNDLEITVLPQLPARPGFMASYDLVFRNKGTTTLSGNVTLNFDDSKMDFNSATIPVSSQSTGEVVWAFTNLAPFQTRSISAIFNILAPPTNNIGDTLTYLATITPVNNDETPANNSYVLSQPVVGSYDPNDKLCAEGNKLDISALNNPLHYVIHFQNLGTDTAFNIVVADTLTNHVDWNSFDFISSSLPCHITRKDNKLEFFFENIKLPYQAINDAASNGYVAFELKPKSSLVVGDSINNTASIYFDFNLPVRTNKATTIVSLLSPVPVKLEYFSLSKQDTGNLLTWKITTADLTTTFNVERSNDGIHFNDIGNLTATTQRCQLPFSFTDSKPLEEKNYYRIKITDANGVAFYSKILVTGNVRSGFEMMAIRSHENHTTLYLDVSKNQTVQIKIIAGDGKLVYAQSKRIVAGTTQLDLQTGNLAKGVYTLIVYTTEDLPISTRFVK